ncbi:phytanoyl-CoA dioxygenase family protein, partial [Candidatus Pelagibacter sp.]|nr:phytanoyl-CoA dioxygenase family protein [Candidatus Pelagibacter sp.]
KGWYEYGKGFVNVLVALDKCTKKNGTIEIAKKHEGGFYNLIKNTKKNFTPDIKPSLEKKIKFQAIELDIGDIVIFSNTCPHRSKKNKTRQHRKTLYYTYLPKEYGFKYNKYFNDKINSKNSTSKSLSGEI